jgi:hypothetical protein
MKPVLKATRKTAKEKIYQQVGQELPPPPPLTNPSSDGISPTSDFLPQRGSAKELSPIVMTKQ